MRIPGYAAAAMAIATAVISAGWLCAALGFGHEAPVKGHCYGRAC